MQLNFVLPQNDYVLNTVLAVLYVQISHSPQWVGVGESDKSEDPYHLFWSGKNRHYPYYSHH